VSEDAAVRAIRNSYVRAREQEAAPAVDNADESMDAFVAGQVLSEWHQNGQFLDSEGAPRPLSLSAGEFTALCRTASVSVAADRVLELLKRAEAAEVEGDRVSARRRELILDCAHPASIMRAIRLSAEFATTLNQNLSRGVQEPRLFERTVVSTKLAKMHVPSLLAYLNIHGQSFLEDLDAWMSAREGAASGPAVGIGVYVFVGTSNA